MVAVGEITERSAMILCVINGGLEVAHHGAAAAIGQVMVTMDCMIDMMMLWLCSCGVLCASLAHCGCCFWCFANTFKESQVTRAI